MTHLKRASVLSLIIAGFVVFVTAQSAMAVGTASNTTISNMATINYSVSGVGQTAIDSLPADFVVDNMVDLTVALQTATIVTGAPGQTLRVLSFRVTNTGNTVQDFDVAAANIADGAANPFGGALLDTFDTAASVVYVDTNNNDSYEDGTDTDTYIDELAADDSIEVFVVSTLPAASTTVINDAISTISLTATATQGGSATVQGGSLTQTTGADTTGVDIVFADVSGTDDAAGFANHSARGAYQIATAMLTITKSSAVYSDPVNGTTNPKAIPGAIVEYTITVHNDAAASATATGISVSDDLNTEITNGTILFDADGYVAGSGIRVETPNLYGGVITTLTNANGDDEGLFSGNIVSVTGISLAVDETATVQFRVVIQ